MIVEQAPPIQETTGVISAEAAKYAMLARGAATQILHYHVVDVFGGDTRPPHELVRKFGLNYIGHVDGVTDIGQGV